MRGVACRDKNFVLIDHYRKLGYWTSAFYEQAGVPFHTGLAYETRKLLAWQTHRGWRESARKIAALLGVGCEQIWPDEAEEAAELEREAQRRFSLAQSSQGQSPEELLAGREALLEIAICLNRLTEDERFCIARYYDLDGEGGATLEAIGRSRRPRPVSGERTRCIIAHGLRRLGHYHRMLRVTTEMERVMMEDDKMLVVASALSRTAQLPPPPYKGLTTLHFWVSDTRAIGPDDGHTACGAFSYCNTRTQQAALVTCSRCRAYLPASRGGPPWT